MLPAQPPDLRLGAPALACWVTALAILGAGVRIALVVAAVGLLLAVASRLAGRRLPRRSRWILPATLVSGAAAALACAAHLATLGSGPLPRLAAAEADVRVELVVSADPVVGTESGPVWDRGRTVTVRASLRRLASEGTAHTGRQPVLVITRHAGWRAVTPGQRVAVSGSLATPDDPGVLAAVLYAQSAPREVGRPPAHQRVAASLRAGLRDSVAGLPPEERGLVPGLVVGDTSRLSERVEAEFKRAGLTHLLAVSGANLAVVTGVVLALGRRAVMPPRVLAVVAALGIVGFVVLARPEPSVLRAAVMGGIALLALATGRPRRCLPALFAAVIVLVYADPTLARSYGFALSVLATFGLLVLAPPWRDRLVARGTPRWLAESLAVPAAAQVMCGPVIVLLASQVNLVGVLANLAAAPAVAPVTVIGVVATVVHPVLPEVAGLIGWCAWPPTWWLVHVGRVAAAVPGAAIGWPGGVGGAVALALVTVGGLLLVPFRRARRAGAAVVAGVLVAGAVLHVTAPKWPPDGWRLVACDVGQGDALVLDAGDGAAVVVDTGQEPAPVRDCLDRLRITRVPLLLVTHLHADHAGGLAGVLRGRRVGAIVTGPLESPPEQWRAVRSDAAAAGVPVSHAVTGTRWRVGPLTLRVLWPPAGSVAPGVEAEESDEESSAENDASLVVRAEWQGLSVLLTGDVEPPGQEELLAAGADLRADVLKVPHHGSSRQDHDFFAATGARAAVISAGVDNDYGHPADRTLDALTARRMRIYRTDRNGDIAFVRPARGTLAVAVRGRDDM
ncbi:MAG: DUF4131 domain-containing protein [Streptosporangiales bacterium]|nr:DUF4131 domain-containing protein [Streptosporangiales bacterium]